MRWSGLSIDQDCEQGLRLLKDLMSHLDPRMSWGGLVARLVREAVPRHDPRGGGSGRRRRRSAGSAGASPRRAPRETRAVGAAVGPACHRGAGGPGSAQRRRYSGAAGRHRRYREAQPDRDAGQRCSSESVRARRTLGSRPRRRRSIGRARRYCGAEVRVRRLGGWLRYGRWRAGCAGRHFGAGAGSRRLGGWVACRRRCTNLAGRHFGAAPGTRRVL